MTDTYEVPEELLARCVGRVDLVKRVIGAFVEQLDEDIPQLIGTVEQGDAADAKKLAHRIKGAAANVAADPLRDAAAQVEELAANQEIAEAETYVAELKTGWEVYKDKVATFIS